MVHGKKKTLNYSIVMLSVRNGTQWEREPCFEGVTIVSLVIYIVSCTAGGMVGGGNSCVVGVLEEGNSSSNCGRHALIPSRDRSATYGRRVELTFLTRKESRGYFCHLGS